MKKTSWLKTFIVFAVATFLFTAGKVYAEDSLNLYFFWGEGCPHCAKEKTFLEKISASDDSVTLHDYEIYYSAENREKLEFVGERIGADIGGVPLLVVGEKYISGYLNEVTTGVEIKRLIAECKQTGCVDIFNPDSEITKPEVIVEETPIFAGPEIPENITEVAAETPSETLPSSPSTTPETPPLPKIANIDLSKLSLPALSIALGFLDGFNPCAMWTLLFLISLLIGMPDRKRMWALGIAFIVTSAAVYFLFMAAWLNLLLFIGFVFWVRIAIGVVALAGGTASLKKFLSKNADGCDVTGDEKRRSVFEKLGKITSNKSFILALLGIIGLAFAVNLVELLCSAGLPAVYTQVLALNNLGTVQYYLYILLYILFFMIDDLFVFFVAMVTLHMAGITTKYVKYSRLIGGVLMLAIGILMIFKPEILMLS